MQKQNRSSNNSAQNGRKQSAKSNKGDKGGGKSGDLEDNNHVISKPLAKKKSSGKPIASGAVKTKDNISSVNKASSTKSNKSTLKSNLKSPKDESKTTSKSKTRVPAGSGSKKVPSTEPNRKEIKSVAKKKAALPVKDSVKVPKHVTKSSKKSTSIGGNNKKGRNNDKPSTGDKKADKKRTTKPELSTKKKGEF